jgi:hypothetical protein
MNKILWRHGILLQVGRGTLREGGKRKTEAIRLPQRILNIPQS